MVASHDGRSRHQLTLPTMRPAPAVRLQGAAPVPAAHRAPQGHVGPHPSRCPLAIARGQLRNARGPSGAFFASPRRARRVLAARPLRLSCQASPPALRAARVALARSVPGGPPVASLSRVPRPPPPLLRGARATQAASPPLPVRAGRRLPAPRRRGPPCLAPSGAAWLRSHPGGGGRCRSLWRRCRPRGASAALWCSWPALGAVASRRGCGAVSRPAAVHGAGPWARRAGARRASPRRFDNPVDNPETVQSSPAKSRAEAQKRPHQRPTILVLIL
jgi:hypothetical protein